MRHVTSQNLTVPHAELPKLPSKDFEIAQAVLPSPTPQQAIDRKKVAGEVAHNIAQSLRGLYAMQTRDFKQGGEFFALDEPNRLIEHLLNHALQAAKENGISISPGKNPRETSQNLEAFLLEGGYAFLPGIRFYQENQSSAPTAFLNCVLAKLSEKKSFDLRQINTAGLQLTKGTSMPYYEVEEVIVPRYTQTPESPLPEVGFLGSMQLSTKGEPIVLIFPNTLKQEASRTEATEKELRDTILINEAAGYVFQREFNFPFEKPIGSYPGFGNFDFAQATDAYSDYCTLLVSPHFIDDLERIMPSPAPSYQLSRAILSRACQEIADPKSKILPTNGVQGLDPTLGSVTSDLLIQHLRENPELEQKAREIGIKHYQAFFTPLIDSLQKYRDRK